MILLKTLILLSFFGSFKGTMAKVTPQIQNVLDNNESTNVIIECSRSPTSKSSMEFDNILKQISQASESPSSTRSDIVTDLVQRLQETVFILLEEIIIVLKELGVKFEVLWISFEIFISEATVEVINRLVRIDIVVKIRHDPIMPHIQPQPSKSKLSTEASETWNIGLINARCKDIDCLGQGVIIGFTDSRVRATHMEIEDNWMGKDTPFGYFDGNLLSCEPTDEVMHGTHVVGSACGKNVGVAPLAKWTMCRSCLPTGCSESSLKICALWLSCPYKCGDTSETKATKNCTARPHVINSSLGGTNYGESIESSNFLYEYIKYWNSLGIISIYTAGNYGPGCNTMSVLAAYDIAFSVGAVDSNVNLAVFSSIGPGLSTKPLTKDSISVGTCSSTKCANQNKTCSLIKPTIVAPGVAVNSSQSENDTSYTLLDGTSMAAPHVAGVVALMICANPMFNWNYKKAYEILTTTTNTSGIDLMAAGQSENSPILVHSNLMCNVMYSNICNSFPNNMYGYGLVNACKAVAVSKKLPVGSNFGWN